jgi:hypothetical protein
MALDDATWAAGEPLFINIGEITMRRNVVLGFVAFCLAAPLAAHAGTKWISAPVFIGQTTEPNGTKHVTYLAAIQSVQPDSAGYYELFVQQTPHYQESYADAIAIKARAECNKAGDNSCVFGKTDWKEMLVTYASP